MPSQRATATSVGLLFVAATGFYVAGQALYGPVLDSADTLELAHPQRSRVLAGILVELVGVLAIPAIALLLYPVLRFHDERSALGYVGVRILEAVALLVAELNTWATITMSRRYLEDGAARAPDWQLLGDAFQAVSESAFLVSVAVIFPVGALLLNSVLWRAKLVPRVISGWGFLGGALLLLGSLLNFFEALSGASPVLLEVVLAGPIAVQEMVLAGWLIVKGFRETHAVPA